MSRDDPTGANRIEYDVYYFDVHSNPAARFPKFKFIRFGRPPCYYGAVPAIVINKKNYLIETDRK